MSSSDRRIWLWAWFALFFVILGATAGVFFKPASTVLILAAVSCAIAMMVEILRVILR